MTVISDGSRSTSAQWRAKHVDLVADRVGLAEQVARVGVARDEPQRPPLARAADEDRDPLLQRPRVADGLGNVDGAALEREANPDPT